MHLVVLHSSSVSYCLNSHMFGDISLPFVQRCMSDKRVKCSFLHTLLSACLVSKMVIKLDGETCSRMFGMAIYGISSGRSSMERGDIWLESHGSSKGHGKTMMTSYCLGAMPPSPGSFTEYRVNNLEEVGRRLVFSFRCPPP